MKGTVDYGMHYKRHGSRDQNTTQGCVDLPRGYMASNSPLNVAGLQSMDYLLILAGFGHCFCSTAGCNLFLIL